MIVSGGLDGTVRVWDLADGSPIGDPLTGHDGPVWGVAVGAREGRPVIVSGGLDGTVRVWDLADGSPIGDPLTGHRSVSAVAVGEREGRPVIVSGGQGRDGTVRVWDLADGSPIGDPLTHRSRASGWSERPGVSAVAVGEREGRPVIVSGGVDGTVRVWDLADPQPLVITFGPALLDLALGPEGVIACATRAGLAAMRIQQTSGITA